MTTPLSPYADMLRRACPEDFGHWPIYIVDRVTVPALAWPGGAGAFTSCTLDMDLREHLVAIGAWAGRGYAMVIDVSVFPTAESLLSIVVHEAAHILLQPEPEPIEDYLAGLADLCKAAGWKDEEETIWSFFKSCGDAPPVGPPPPPWDNHESGFIRAALHLWARFRDVLELRSLNVAGAHYDLTILPAYESKLEDELLAHPTGSIRSILATPEPAGFAALSRLDTEG
jgi:hypothetical protein